MHLRKRPMTLINQLLASPLFALSIVLLIVIAALLIGVLVVLVKRRKPTTVVLDTTGFTAELDRIMKSTAHAAEVSAVLGLMKDLENNPDALALIQDYPETVRAAAWLHYINRLGRFAPATGQLRYPGAGSFVLPAPTTPPRWGFFIAKN